MDKDKIFVNKFCALEFHDGFVLHGFVDDANGAGIFFRTKQKTSFIAWTEIRQLKEERGGQT